MRKSVTSTMQKPHTKTSQSDCISSMRYQSPQHSWYWLVECILPISRVTWVQCHTLQKGTKKYAFFVVQNCCAQPHVKCIHSTLILIAKGSDIGPYDVGLCIQWLHLCRACMVVRHWVLFSSWVWMVCTNKTFFTAQSEFFYIFNQLMRQWITV